MSIERQQRIERPDDQPHALGNGEIALRQLQPVANPVPAILRQHDHPLGDELQVRHRRSARLLHIRAQEADQHPDRTVAVECRQHVPTVIGN